MDNLKPFLSTWTYNYVSKTQCESPQSNTFNPLFEAARWEKKGIFGLPHPVKIKQGGWIKLQTKGVFTALGGDITKGTIPHQDSVIEQTAKKEQRIQWNYTSFNALWLLPLWLSSRYTLLPEKCKKAKQNSEQCLVNTSGRGSPGGGKTWLKIDSCLISNHSEVNCMWQRERS